MNWIRKLFFVACLIPLGGAHASAVDSVMGRAPHQAQLSGRILVKYKSDAAARIEGALNRTTLQLQSPGQNPALTSLFQNVHIHAIQPLFPDHVRQKLDLHLTSAERAARVQARYPRRAGHWSVPAQLPDLTQHYILDPDTKSADEIQRIVDVLRRDPTVEFAAPEYIRYAELTPTGFNANTQWDIVKISAPSAWDSSTGSGVIVADLDTGLDATHPDLVPNLIPGYNYYAASNPTDLANMTDTCGHGTHTAGTLAGAGVADVNGNTLYGVAFHVRLMPIKVLADSGCNGSDSVIAQGIQYAVDHGAQVLNMSIGGAGYTPVFDEAITYAHGLNAVVVCAAGNSSGDVAGTAFYPADSADAITVASVSSTDSPSAFSNFGEKIDVAAPGENILSTYLGHSDVGMTGTSMATPHVAGLAALILSLHPSFNSEQVRQIIRAAATDVSDPGWDIHTGYGRINAQAAMQITGSNTIPVVNTFTPPNVARGGGNTPFIVNGSNFTPNSVVQMRHVESMNAFVTLATQFVSSTEMSATIAGSDLTSGDLRIRVSVPSVGFSNERNLSVTYGVVPPVSVSVAPTSASLGINQSQTFSALVLNAADASVQWTISPTGIGSLSTSNNSATYTAPATLTTQQTLTLIAQSHADGSKKAQAAITLTPSLSTKLSVAPAALNFSGLVSGTAPASQTFTLSNSGNIASNWSASSNVTWASVSPTNGSLSASNGTGLLTVSISPGALSSGQYNGRILLSDQINSQQTVIVALALSASPSTVTLATPNLSSIDGKTFTMQDTLTIPYDGMITGFNWQFDPGSAGVQSSRDAALSYASTIATPASSLSLGSLSLSVGTYTVHAQAIDGAEQSIWANAHITIVESNLSAVRVYPNPWRADKHAQYPITFNGLAAATRIRIFSVSGRLVRDIPNASGLATWDLKNDSGDDVASGLYIYLLTDGQGNQTRGKLAIIK